MVLHLIVALSLPLYLLPVGVADALVPQLSFAPVVPVLLLCSPPVRVVLLRLQDLFLSLVSISPISILLVSIGWSAATSTADVAPASLGGCSSETAVVSSLVVTEGSSLAMVCLSLAGCSSSLIVMGVVRPAASCC